MAERNPFREAVGNLGISLPHDARSSLEVSMQLKKAFEEKVNKKKGESFSKREKDWIEKAAEVDERFGFPQFTGANAIFDKKNPLVKIGKWVTTKLLSGPRNVYGIVRKVRICFFDKRYLYSTIACT